MYSRESEDGKSEWSDDDYPNKSYVENSPQRCSRARKGLIAGAILLVVVIGLGSAAFILRKDSRTAASSSPDNLSANNTPIPIAPVASNIQVAPPTPVYSAPSGEPHFGIVQARYKHRRQSSVPAPESSTLSTKAVSSQAVTPSVSSIASNPVPVAPASGTPTVVRNGGHGDWTARGAAVNTSSSTFTEGKFLVRNQGTGLYMTFTQETGNILVVPEAQASPLKITFDGNAAGFARFDGLGCGTAQWDYIVGKFIVAFAMYACGNPTAPVDKFHWFLLPLSEASTVQAVSGKNKPGLTGSRQRKRSTGNPAGPFFLIPAAHLLSQTTSAVTGLNISTWSNHPEKHISLAVTDWNPTDPFQLWSFVESV